MADRWFEANYANDSATLRLHVYTVDKSTEGNWSKERADLYLRVNKRWGYYNNYGTTAYIGINGNNTTRTVTFDTTNSNVGDHLLLIGTWDTTVWHDNNGNATIGVGCSHATDVGLGTASGNSDNGWSWHDGGAGGNWYQCDNIPRYANFTQHYISSKTINTVSIHWEADSNVIAWQHSINSGSWNDCNGGNTYVISNLSPNTTYYIRTRIKRVDGGPWKESSNISVKTYNIAKFSSYDSILKIGDNLNLKYTNPSNAPVEVGIFKTDGETPIVGYKSYDNNGIYTITENETLNLYKQLKDSNSYIARMYIKTIQNGKTYLQYRDITIKASGNIKTAYIKESDVVKRAKVYIKINGVVKQVVVWKKKNGTVMRCI